MKSPASPEISRRDFVRQACCAAVGTTGILSALGQLRAIGAIAGDSLSPVAASVSADYKALGLPFPQRRQRRHQLDRSLRSIGLRRVRQGPDGFGGGAVCDIADYPQKYSDGRSYGLHPAVPGLQSLFASGKMAVLANVGTLVRPTSLADYQVGKNLPPQLFSHSDQTLQWQSSIPDQPFETGWGGRLADIVDAMNSNNQVSMSITLYGSNSFQRGRVVDQFAMSASGPGSLVYGAGASAFRAIMATPQTNALAAAFGKITGEAVSDGDAINTAFKSAPSLKTVFPGTPTASSLAMVAKLISVSQALGLKRQIFFVNLNGFDLHGSQATGHGPLLAETSAAMKAFYDSTVELGVANQVTTFTASDFGRTYVPNASGTDHGWGNHQLIMGGAVEGGDIYGRMPSLTINADDDTGRGRWIPSTSVDEYNATLATWFGVSAANLPVVLPNIGRFAKPNLGFMG